MAQQRAPQPHRQTAEPARLVHRPALPRPRPGRWKPLDKLLERELRAQHRDVLGVGVLSRELLPVGGPSRPGRFVGAVEPG